MQNVAGMAGVSGIKARIRAALPAPAFQQIQTARGRLARAVAGTELHRLRQENDQLRAELAAALDQHGRDVVARSDAVLAGYDRRLAAIANRVVDLEQRPAAAAGEAEADANRILADHQDHLT